MGMTSFDLAFTELWCILLLYFVLLAVGAIWYVSPGRFNPTDKDNNKRHSQS